MKKSIKVLAMAVACAAACALPTACNSDNKQPENQPDTPEVQRQEFTVTFRNGDNVTREQVESGATVTRPNNPSKDGHRFLGWYLNNIEYNFTTPITGNLVLEAKWEVEITTCNVTFNPNNETESTITEVDSGSTVTEPADPIKTDSGFLGWYDEDGNLFDFTTTINSDITLHAEWTEDFTCEINGNETAFTITGYTGDATNTNIVLPKSYNGKPVTAIGDSAFSDCMEVESVVIPNTVTSIGDFAFCYCYSLENIEIPDSVTSIGIQAFGSCIFTTINIPSSVESMGGGIFYDCWNLTTIYCNAIPNENWDDDWLDDRYPEVVWGFDMVDLFDYELNQDGESYNITNTKSDINWNLIEEVTLPTQYNGKPITEIFNYTFEGSGIKSVIIPEGYTHISSDAFIYCHDLESITIPSTVTEECGFTDCENLKTIYCYADTTDWDENWNQVGYDDKDEPIYAEVIDMRNS